MAAPMNDVTRARTEEAVPDAGPRTITGAEIIWETLVNEGVDVVFGYPGGAIMPAYDAMIKYPIRHILVRHEQGAAHMADGYARASGKVGVAMATSGPGATNLVTGIADAMLDSIPIVCITGQVPSWLLGTRRVPGDRHHRRHAADHQAQLPGDQARGHHAGDPPGVLHRELRPPGPGGGRHHQGRAAEELRVQLGRHAGAAARLPARSSPVAASARARGRDDPRAPSGR